MKRKTKNYRMNNTYHQTIQALYSDRHYLLHKLNDQVKTNWLCPALQRKSHHLLAKAERCTATGNCFPKNAKDGLDMNHHRNKKYHFA
jgi:hypothetical protein